MLLRFPLLIVAFNFLAATTSAYPTWTLAVFQFRCKAPFYVESYSDEWSEWRVSSICAPGLCCSNSASTGPLCTVEACQPADVERERILKAQNRLIASKKADEERLAKAAFGTAAGEAKAKEAEAKWKLYEAELDAEREKAFAEPAQLV